MLCFVFSKVGGRTRYNNIVVVVVVVVVVVAFCGRARVTKEWIGNPSL